MQPFIFNLERFALSKAIVKHSSYHYAQLPGLQLQAKRILKGELSEKLMVQLNQYCDYTRNRSEVIQGWAINVVKFSKRDERMRVKRKLRTLAVNTSRQKKAPSLDTAYNARGSPVRRLLLLHRVF